MEDQEAVWFPVELSTLDAIQSTHAKHLRVNFLFSGLAGDGRAIQTIRFANTTY